MKSVRIYNRALTAAEVAQNWKADVARFDGVLPSVNVVVAGKYSDYEGAALGEYEVTGSFDFTAGPATDDEGKVRPVKGYTIETRENDAWSRPERRDGASYTYTAGVDPAMVRITWIWRADGTRLFIR